MALVRGCSVGLGATAMAKDLGYEFELHVHTDSSAAKGVAGRRGVGKIRHLHTPLLWVQHRLQRGDLKLFKVAGKDNRSDLATKYVDGVTLMRHLEALGFTFECGRSGLALRAALG